MYTYWLFRTEELLAPCGSVHIKDIVLLFVANSRDIAGGMVCVLQNQRDIQIVSMVISERYHYYAYFTISMTNLSRFELEITSDKLFDGRESRYAAAVDQWSSCGHLWPKTAYWPFWPERVSHHNRCPQRHANTAVIGVNDAVKSHIRQCDIVKRGPGVKSKLFRPPMTTWSSHDTRLNVYICIRECNFGVLRLTLNSTFHFL